MGDPAYPNTSLWPAASGLYPGDGGEVGPSVTTGTAGPVGITSATLHGTVDPNGLQTYFYFEYGWGPAPYGYQSAEGNAGAGGAPIAVQQDVTTIGARHYHYRIVAYSSAGFAYGEDRTFNTNPGRDDPHRPFLHQAGRGQ